MSRKSKSAKTSKPPAKPERGSAVGRGIIQGLKEAVAFSRGEIALPVRLVAMVGAVDVRAIRANSGLSQAEFADRYGFNRRTLQDWEQGRAQPDAPVRAYLMVIQHEPDAVVRALQASGMVRQAESV